MRIGVTATRFGATELQKKAFRRLIKWATELHNGLCEGGDDDAWEIATYLKVPVIGHPPTDESQMVKRKCSAMRPPLPHLKRNQKIVEESQKLIAMPRGYEEEQRSGTWATIRYARKLGRPIVIIWPNGTLSMENER